jgi:D-3-phosphoglycerate dehydrogenase
MPDILITENITGSEMDALLQKHDGVFAPDLWKQPEKLHAMIPQFRSLIVRNQTKVTRALIRAGDHLEVIGRAGVGIENIDLEAASDHGIVVAFTPEQNTNSVAELAIGLIFALARQLTAAHEDTKRGGWDRQRFEGIEALGKTLGLIGFGRIGASTAMKARALGMDLIAYDPFVDPESLKAMELRARLTSLEEVLHKADFISCHLPETPDTTRLLGYEQFCLMKSNAFFINTSRGRVVDEDGLVRALQEKKIAGAALDVRAQEPPSPSPLGEMENVILIPHIGAFTREAQRRVVTAVCRDVGAVLNGEAAKNFANFSRPRK